MRQRESLIQKFREKKARVAILGMGYEIINLGGHETITINQMIAMLEELTGKKAHLQNHPAHRADILANWADISKAKRLLGWEPQMDLVEGMKHLVDWYRSERDWAKEVATP